MMDILVKSFNRPWYLERCIRSIYRHVTGEFKIVVLDDGTPPEYLDRIRQLFPEIRIELSAAYPQKVVAIQQHVAGAKTYDQFRIPIDLWRNTVKAATPYFLMFEDDIWFNHPINLDALHQDMAAANMMVAKIGWSGNPNTNRGEKQSVSAELEQIVPELPSDSSVLLRLLARNTFKIRSIAFRMKLIDDQFNLPYYAMYGVAAAIFNKAYWLHLWQDASLEVNEGLQLAKAVSWKNKHQDSTFGKTKQEYCLTSYISSATNRMPGVDFDMIAANHYINEAWLQNKLDAMEQFPADFSLTRLKGLLQDAADPRCTPDHLEQWVHKFKAQYIKMGCDVG